MIRHNDISNEEVRAKIKAKKIHFAGNSNLKIYGILSCKSGKRMKTKNRVFFSSEATAIKNGYRPCGHCMRTAYKKWKNETIRGEN